MQRPWACRHPLVQICWCLIRQCHAVQRIIQNVCSNQYGTRKRWPFFRANSKLRRTRGLPEGKRSTSIQVVPLLAQHTVRFSKKRGPRAFTDCLPPPSEDTSACWPTFRLQSFQSEDTSASSQRWKAVLALGDASSSDE